MKSPKVSFCLPTYNYARYLPEAIESVLAQTFTDFELLIIDDRSTDDSAAVIERYAQQDSRIIFAVNEQNLGMVANWNLCLARARGEYVRFIFGDDYLTSPQALRLMVDALDRYPDVVLVGSARNVVDELSSTKRIVSHFLDRTRYRGREVVRRSLLEQRNIVGEPSAVMFRRQLAGRGYDPAYRQMVDMEMWFHLLGQGNFYYLATPLVAFREHDAQQSVHNARAGVFVDEITRLTADYGNRPEIVSPFWRWLLACLARNRARRWSLTDDSSDGRFPSSSVALFPWPLHNLLYKFVKLVLKLGYRCGAGRISG